MNHRMKHLCCHDNRLLGLDALGDDATLNTRNFLNRHLYTQITTGNHDTIRSLDNLVDVIDTFLILYLRDDLDVAMMLVQNVLNGLHIGSTTHK